MERPTASSAFNSPTNRFSISSPFPPLLIPIAPADPLPLPLISPLSARPRHSNPSSISSTFASTVSSSMIALLASGSYGGKSGFGSEGVAAVGEFGESGSVSVGTSGSATAAGKARVACATEGMGARGERRATFVGAAESVVDGFRSSGGIACGSRELATVLMLVTDAFRAYVDDPSALVGAAVDPFDDAPRFDTAGTCRGRFDIEDPVGEPALLDPLRSDIEGRCGSDCCCELYELEEAAVDGRGKGLVRLVLVVRGFDGVAEVALWSDVGRIDRSARFSRVELLRSDA